MGYRWPTTVASGALLSGLVLFTVVVGTMLAFFLFVYGLRHLAATEAGIASSFEPIVAATGGLLILGVTLSGLQYTGGALIVIAVVWLGGTVHERVEPSRRVGHP
jgi:drug/metabolite transporter (DMT)-like permease